MSPARTARLTGDPGPPPRALAGADRRCERDAAGAGSATPTAGSRSSRSAGRTARARSPASSPTSSSGPAGGSGRPPRTGCSSTSGSSSRATGPAPAAPSGPRSRRRRVAVLETARGGIVLRGVGYESNDASVLTNVSVRPPRPPGHPHPARAGRGQGDDLPDHAARRLGRPQRRRPPGRARWPVGSAPGWRCSASTSDERRRSAVTSWRGGRAYVVRRRGARRGRRRGGPARSSRSSRSRSRSAGSPGTTWRTPWPRPAGRAGPRARRSRTSPTGCATSAPDADRSPGRLNLFRLGGRVVIVDFAHNEAGIAAVLDVAEGIAGGAAGRAAPITVIIGTAGDRPGRHAPRDRPDRRPTRPAGRDQGDASATSAGGPARRSSASSSQASSPAGGRRPRSPSTTSETAALRAELERRRVGGRGARAAAGRGPGRRAHVPRAARRRVRAPARARRPADRRCLRAHRAPPAPPGSAPPVGRLGRWRSQIQRQRQGSRVAAEGSAVHHPGSPVDPGRLRTRSAGPPWRRPSESSSSSSR